MGADDDPRARSMLARRLLLALVAARDAAGVERALAQVEAAQQPDERAPEALSLAARLRVLRAVADAGDALPWPVAHAVAEARAAHEARFDAQQLAACVAGRWEALAPWLLEALARGVDDAGRGADDALRAARCVARCEGVLARCFAACEAPRGVCAARAIDAVRAAAREGSLDEVARGALYEALVRAGVDPRSALADEGALGPAARARVLGALARRRARSPEGVRARARFAAALREALEPPREGALEAPLVYASLAAVLRRAGADWSAAATHPRQLGEAARRALAARGLDEAAQARVLRASLEALRGNALGDVLRAWVEGALEGAPDELRAEPLGPGVYECARCGADEVWPDAREGEREGEGERALVCRGCGQAYHFDPRDGRDALLGPWGFAVLLPAPR